MGLPAVTRRRQGYGAACIVALLCLSPAAAYWQSRQQISVGSAPAYAGPGDVVSGALTWWGLRAYNAATKGNALINVCSPADAACADFSSDATTGALVIVAVGGHTCADDCTIKKFYDQSGANSCSAAACDWIQNTIGNRATLINFCHNSKPCARSVEISNTQYVAANFPGAANPGWTISGVFNQTGGTAGQHEWISTSFVSVGVDNTSGGLCYQINFAPFTATCTGSTWHAVQYVGNGAAGASTNYVDGNTTTGDDAFALQAASILFGSNNLSTVQGDFVEFGVWGIAFSTQLSSMNSNQTTYWGPF